LLMALRILTLALKIFGTKSTRFHCNNIAIPIYSQIYAIIDPNPFTQLSNLIQVLINSLNMEV
jgi:hypothetical protein